LLLSTVKYLNIINLNNRLVVIFCIKTMVAIPPIDVQTGIAQETLLRRITNRIRQSLELEDIITATTA
jgi:hypothetical protein